MKAVATGDVVADHFMFGSVLLVSEPRRVRIQIQYLDALGLIDDGAAGGFPGIHQILGHFGLAIDHDAGAGMFLEIDAVAIFAETNFEAVMDQAFLIHALGAARGAQHVDHALFQHPGADAPQHIFGAAPFQDHAVDALKMKKLAQEEPRRPGPDDSDLCPHDLIPWLAWRRLINQWIGPPHYCTLETTIMGTGPDEQKRAAKTGAEQGDETRPGIGAFP